MQDTGFFGFMWRFNAIAIGLAASGVIVALALIFGAFVMTFVRESRFRAETELVDRGDAPASSVTYSLGRAEEIEGTDIILYPLDRTYSVPRPIPIKGAYSYTNDVVNLLLADGSNASGRWMFEGVRQAFRGRTFVYDPATLNAGAAKRTAVALLIEVCEADTNKDGLIDSSDDSALLAYTIKDGARHEMLKGSLLVTSMRQTSDGKILVMYEEGQKTILARFAADDFRLLAKTELPRLSTEARSAAPN